MIGVIDNALAASWAFIICLLNGSPYGEDDRISTPEEVSDYKVYWNVPTFQCHKYGLNFSQVRDWGIEQNEEDQFRGETISILYDPGLGILDFEHWRPIWNQNWGTLDVYRRFSRSVERRKHPFWFSSMIENEAASRYETRAKMFILETLKEAKVMRPEAQWGYYGYPFCFNFTPNNNREKCSDEVIKDNDRIEWLFSEMTALYPSLYLKEKDMSRSLRKRFVQGRLDEAIRVAEKTSLNIYPYVWPRYHDSVNFLSSEDMHEVLAAPKERKCSGVIIWGASKDVNSRDKCVALLNYLDSVIGPAVYRIRYGGPRGKGKIPDRDYLF